MEPPALPQDEGHGPHTSPSRVTPNSASSRAEPPGLEQTGGSVWRLFTSCSACSQAGPTPLLLGCPQPPGGASEAARCSAGGWERFPDPGGETRRPPPPAAQGEGSSLTGSPGARGLSPPSGPVPGPWEPPHSARGPLPAPAGDAPCGIRCLGLAATVGSAPAASGDGARACVRVRVRVNSLRRTTHIPSTCPSPSHWAPRSPGTARPRPTPPTAATWARGHRAGGPGPWSHPGRQGRRYPRAPLLARPLPTWGRPANSAGGKDTGPPEAAGPPRPANAPRARPAPSCWVSPGSILGPAPWGRGSQGHTLASLLPPPALQPAGPPRCT